MDEPKIEFYCVDKGAGSRSTIGVSGTIIQKLTPYYGGEVIYGTIIDYSYVKGAGEFFFWLSDNMGRNEEMFFLGVGNQEAWLSMISPERKTIKNSIPWKQTKRYHTKQKAERLRELGIQNNEYYLQKELTPRNALRVALPEILKAKQEGRI